MEQSLRAPEDIQLAGVLASIRLLHVNNLQTEVISQFHLSVLSHQQSPN